MPTLTPWGRRVVALVALGLLAASCTRSPLAGAKPTHHAAGTPSASPTPPSSPSPAPTGSGSTPPPPALVWHPCGSPFQCSSINVPLDWSQPTNGPTVKLAIIRLPASGAQSQRIGSLFVNPGGPGASAVDFVRTSVGTLLPTEILRRFDIIGFDPRGIGSSQPLQCLNGPEMDAYLALDPAPSTPAEVNTVVAASKQFAAGCVKDAGKAFLAHMDTQDTARDMDYIRQALGDPKLTYVGYSYGTFLGAQYAKLFPTHVRALALDGAVDPATGALSFDAIQAVGFDKELGDYFANCGNGCAFASGSTPAAAFNALEAKVTATPLRVGSRQLDLALFIDGVADGLYSPNLWPELTSALNEAVKGDGSGLLAMSDDLTERNPNGTYDAITSASPAVNCVDSTYPTDPAAYQAAAAAAAQQAPVFGAAIVWSSLICAYWPVPPVIHPAPVHAAGAPPILVIGTTGDPATPYQQAVNLASELRSGVLLTHVGLGHTSLAQDSACVNNAETTYLISLVPPANGSVCGNSSAPPSPSPAANTVAYAP